MVAVHAAALFFLNGVLLSHLPFGSRLVAVVCLSFSSFNHLFKAPCASPMPPGDSWGAAEGTPWH